MTYNITHRTLYEYAAPVTVSHHVARLEPRATSTQEQESFSLKVFPEPALRKARTDYFGNRLCLFSVQEIHSKLEIITYSRVTVGAKKFPTPEKFAGVGRNRPIVPRSGFARSRRAVSIHFRFAASARVVRVDGIRRGKVSRTNAVACRHA
ncbi:MAG: transglutaminase N-terminal domain-containing protein [Limisphaerales bacterium]